MKRYELKFYLTLHEAAYLSKRLGTFLNLDDNVCDNKSCGYQISSLYFDSVHSTSSWEKLGGFQKREKFRIRIYNPPWSQGDPIKFEIKRKLGDLVEKKLLRVDFEEACALINGSSAPFYDKISGSSVFSYLKFRKGHYTPFVIIDYFRKAFHARVNNLRVTLDYDLAASKDFKNFFQPDAKRDSSTILCQYCILEIKFNHFFPLQYKYIFDGLNCVRSAISKYVMGLAGSNVHLEGCNVLSKSPFRAL